jgi:hypothetical protein
MGFLFMFWRIYFIGFFVKEVVLWFLRYFAIYRQAQIY